jgi:hypothetical protein
MTMTTDDIFDNVDLGLDEPDLEPQSTSTDDFTEGDIFTDSEPITTNSVIDSLLASKGITDGKIVMIEEDGTESEVSFYDLSLEEQIEILNQGEITESPDLDEKEVDLLNKIRSSGLTADQYLEQYKQQVLSELGQTPTQNYEIDNYTDQELYILDLKNKFDLTEEELVTELEKELQNEDLFTRKVTKLREEYKKLEDEYKQTQQQEFEAQRQQQYDQFAQQMVDIAVKTPDFYGIELEDDEKNEVLSFLLELDEDGTSNFYKSLNDPGKLYEAAWFLRYGKDAFDALKNAYESEIAKLKKEDKRQVVVRKSNEKINSIHDLNF